ncbi:hypothetical protein PG997_010435 [Apiospora hydei]|uniref:C2H2-type domain-containing protein n=1 Tax=Apiospora hydei TaxID=1337664 RepID=A0ABR1VY45_9PEZI
MAAPGSTLQARSGNHPPPILVYQNVPLEDRSRLDITPADPKWKEMLAYFNTLLNTPGVTLDQILKDHFTAHELCKFVPTKLEPHAKWQQQDTELFRRTLETRFKGVLPTLAMKITMLYFGCPVAPMKFGETTFLGGYKERCYGLPPTEVTFIPIGTPSTEEGAYSPSMRGGFLEDEDMELVESQSQCDEDMDSPSQDGPAAELGLPRREWLGSKGQADVSEGYNGLAQGVTRLLSLDVDERKRDVQLVFTIIGSRSGRCEVKATVHAPIGDHPDGAEGPLSDILERIQCEERPLVFVRRESDVAPTTFEPKPLDGGIATITYRDDDDLERKGYLRTARRPNLNHSVTHYATSYQHTINALIGSHHQWITFPDVPGPAGPVRLYSCEDIPQQLISNIATHTYCGINAIVERIDPNIVPVILPDSQSHYTSNAIELYRQNLGDLEALNRVVEHTLSRLPGRRKIADGLHVYFPGEDFQNSNRGGYVFIGLMDGRATEDGFNAWQKYIQPSRFSNPKGASLVVQPWFEIYIISAPQSMQSVPGYQTLNVRLIECNLQLFKMRVAKDLYPGNYDPDNKEHTLILEDEIRSSRHVITHESNEDDWQRILRRLMCQNLEVTLKTKDRDARWNVDENSYWGPSYYRAQLNYIPSGNPDVGNANNSTKSSNLGFNRSNVGSTNGSVKTFGTSRSQEIADSLYKTYSSRLNDFIDMKGSDNSMRDLTHWDTPSIFTNPAKPVMPLHAPPLESVIRTGPDVPAITLGMRTATETARLEREVHTLRGQLLDRIRDCPYIDCDKRFSYMDMIGFERHIKYEHKVLQCAFCIAFKPPTAAMSTLTHP